MASSSYIAYDRLLGGKLGEHLVEMRRAGKSFDEIVDTLREVHEINVSRSTVFRWVAIAEAATSDQAAS